MKKRKPKVYYYDDSTIDFVNTKTNTSITIDDKYDFIITRKWAKLCGFLLYYLIALPIFWIEGFVFRGVRVKGKKKIKALKKQGYIMYSNHSNYRDAFMGPVYLANNKRTYVVCNKDALCIRGVRDIVRSLGALPVPDTLSGLRAMNKAVKELLNKKKAIIIFPEAHIWPYYNGVREFPITSFKFAVNNKVPAIPVAVCYSDPKGLFKDYKKPRVTIYIGDPIYIKEGLTDKENATYLRDKTYEYIKQTVEKYSYTKQYVYIKKENEGN